MSKDEYARLAHAMQSGVAYEMNYDHYNTGPTTPKHLRVGINAAMSDMGGLVRLLISKGVITEEEYAEAVTEKMREEVQAYEARLTERLGSKVTLA
jgi:hypothetical protein